MATCPPLTPLCVRVEGVRLYALTTPAAAEVLGAKLLEAIEQYEETGRKLRVETYGEQEARDAIGPPPKRVLT